MSKETQISFPKHIFWQLCIQGWRFFILKLFFNLPPDIYKINIHRITHQKGTFQSNSDSFPPILVRNHRTVDRFVDQSGLFWVRKDRKMAENRLNRGSLWFTALISGELLVDIGKKSAPTDPQPLMAGHFGPNKPNDLWLPSGQPLEKYLYDSSNFELMRWVFPQANSI